MKKSITPRLTILAAAVAAALVIPIAAFGATRPDDRSGVRGPGTAPATQVVGDQPGLSARPDNRAGVLGIGGTSSVDEAAAASGGDGFDWAAAGIGAGATAGVLMLLVAAALVGMPRHQHRRATA